MFLYLYTSLASIIFHGTPRYALSYNNINSKTYKATMGHIFFNGITTLLWHGSTLLWYRIIMFSHYYDITLVWYDAMLLWRHIIIIL